MSVIPGDTYAERAAAATLSGRSDTSVSQPAAELGRIDLNTDQIEQKLDTLNITNTGGTYGYAAGTSTGTIDVPSGARVKRVSVVAGASAATLTIAGGATITVPSGTSFDESIPGQATLGGDVVIGGTVTAYYVGWVS